MSRETLDLTGEDGPVVLEVSDSSAEEDNSLGIRNRGKRAEVVDISDEDTPIVKPKEDAAAAAELSDEDIPISKNTATITGIISPAPSVISVNSDPSVAEIPAPASTSDVTSSSSSQSSETTADEEDTALPLLVPRNVRREYIPLPPGIAVASEVPKPTSPQPEAPTAVGRQKRSLLTSGDEGASDLAKKLAAAPQPSKPIAKPKPITAPKTIPSTVIRSAAKLSEIERLRKQLQDERSIAAYADKLHAAKNQKLKAVVKKKAAREAHTKTQAEIDTMYRGLIMDVKYTTAAESGDESKALKSARMVAASARAEAKDESGSDSDGNSDDSGADKNHSDSSEYTDDEDSASSSDDDEILYEAPKPKAKLTAEQKAALETKRGPAKHKRVHMPVARSIGTTNLRPTNLKTQLAAMDVLRNNGDLCSIETWNFLMKHLENLKKTLDDTEIAGLTAKVYECSVPTEREKIDKKKLTEYLIKKNYIAVLVLLVEFKVLHASKEQVNTWRLIEFARNGSTLHLKDLLESIKDPGEKSRLVNGTDGPMPILFLPQENFTPGWLERLKLLIQSGAGRRNLVHENWRCTVLHDLFYNKGDSAPRIRDVEALAATDLILTKCPASKELPMLDLQDKPHTHAKGQITGRTALIQAAADGRLAVCSRLLSAGANPYLKDSRNDDFLHRLWDLKWSARTNVPARVYSSEYTYGDIYHLIRKYGLYCLIDEKMREQMVKLAEAPTALEPTLTIEDKNYLTKMLQMPYPAEGTDEESKAKATAANAEKAYWIQHGHAMKQMTYPHLPGIRKHSPELEQFFKDEAGAGAASSSAKPAENYRFRVSAGKLAAMRRRLAKKREEAELKFAPLGNGLGDLIKRIREEELQRARDNSKAAAVAPPANDQANPDVGIPRRWANARAPEETTDMEIELQGRVSLRDKHRQKPRADDIVQALTQALASIRFD